MGAILGGCFTFISLMFLLAFCIQFPAIFWGIVAVFVTAIVLGLREGFRRKREGQASSPNPIYKMPAVDSDEEGDIRHHYDIGGTPMSIGNPKTIQNESMSLGDEEDEHH